MRKFVSALVTLGLAATPFACSGTDAELQAASESDAQEFGTADEALLFGGFKGHWGHHRFPFAHYRHKRGRGHHWHHHPPACDEDTPLAQAACLSGKLMGAAVAYDPLVGEEEYAEALEAEFNYVTPENEMKWGSLQPVDSNSWDFTRADAIVAAAKAANQQVKGHALVWHQQLPSFVNDSLSAKQLRKLMKNHIKRTVSHFEGKLKGWDVVNEAVADGGGLRDSVFLRLLGPDYIVDAFKLAKDEDRKTKLYYNDYGIETINAKSDSLYALMQEWLAKRAPIDGVGMQMHLDARNAPTTQQLVDNFARFAALGLKINISELDVRIAGVAGSQTQKLALQQQIYHRVVDACMRTAACDAITVWGVSDKYSWIDATFAPDDPLPLDEQYQIKPAYYGMVDGLLGLPSDAPGVAPNLLASGSLEVDAAGWYGFGIAGVELTTQKKHSGLQSALGSGRTDTWQGPAVSLTQLVQPGFVYEVGAFTRLLGATSDTLTMSLKTQCAGEDATFQNLATGAATASSWVERSSTFTLPNCEFEDVTVYFEGPAAGVDILVDDVTLREKGEPLGPNLVANGDFESGVAGWFGFGPVTLAQSGDANGGAASLLASGRGDTWQGPATNLLPAAVQGGAYRVSAFAKVSGASGANVNLTIKSVCDGVTAFTPLATASATSGEWAALNGTYTVPLCSNLSELTLYLEGPAAGVDILVDDVAVQQRLSIPVEQPPSGFNIAGNGGGELGTAEWASFGSTVSQSSLFAHSGAVSIVGAARAGTWAGPAYNLPAGTADYQVSVYGLHNSASSETLLFGAKLTCGGVDSYPFLGAATANPGEWVQLSGTLNVGSDCTVAQVIVSGPATSVDIYADDLVVLPTSASNLAGNPGLESGAAGWQGFGATLGTTSSVVHSGSNAAFVSGRTADWQGGAFAVAPTGVGTYSAKIWARHTAGVNVDLRFSAKLTCNGADSYPTIATVTAAGDTWTELAGNYAVPAGCTAALLYVHQAGGAVFPDLYLDDLTLSPVFQ